MEGGNFYYHDFIDASRLIYKENWTKIALAFSMWLNEIKENNIDSSYLHEGKIIKTFNLLFGKL